MDDASLISTAKLILFFASLMVILECVKEAQRAEWDREKLRMYADGFQRMSEMLSDGALLQDAPSPAK